MTDTAFYVSKTALATRMLVRFGQAATLQRKATGPYDPMTGTASETVTPYPCLAFVENYSVRDLGGTVIQASDRRVYLAPDVAVVPKPGDTLVIDGADLTAINVKPVSPAGTVVLFEVQARGQ